MNPQESRNSQNPNRVRSFKEQDLHAGSAGQNWDRVKVGIMFIIVKVLVKKTALRKTVEIIKEWNPLMINRVSVRF